MSGASLFDGIAVVIDDEIEDPKSTVWAIRQQIIGAGSHVVPLSKLPSKQETANLREVALVLLDWNLTGTGEAGVQLPSQLQRQLERDNIAFIGDLHRTRCAPVFIFTDGPVERIVTLLTERRLYDASDPSHIMVAAKRDVISKGVFSVLDDWLKKAPSAFALKCWEREHSRAKNDLFVDLYTKSTLWPLLLWEAFRADSVSPDAQLGEIISSNLASRIVPFECDLDPMMPLLDDLKGNSTSYHSALQRVFEGERFLPKKKLSDGVIQPGDLFKKGGKYYINIRPLCDCIARDGVTQDDVELYLLRGDKMKPADLQQKYSERYGVISETDVEAIVFPVLEGIALQFRFKDFQVAQWKGFKDKRIGRLVPPFLTRLQQRYAAYLQRPGLTRLPPAAFGTSTAGSTPSAEDAVREEPGAPAE